MAEGLWNDIMYSEVLTTPGYVVDYAVGTTYSLDLTTLLSVPFMLGTMGELTEDTMKSPHYIMEAINRSASKFTVFCNAGSIAVPQNTQTKIFSLLEQSVMQIGLGKSGRGFVNFHPKVWILKETNAEDESSQIKVVVMSRNLTRSNDLDVVCELTGTIGSKPASADQKRKHAPLVDFLMWLRERSYGKHAKNNITRLCECIERVKTFDLSDTPFGDYDFFPMGLDGYDGRESCLSKMLDHAAETVIISPFIDAATLREFTESCPAARKTLITRHASITPETLALINDGVYAVKEVLTDKTEKETTVDIHEKVYFIRNSKTGYNHLYLGSTNATANGFGRNVEFLVGLRFTPNKTGYYMFRSDLINDNRDCMFEQVLSVPEVEKEAEDTRPEQYLREAISAISSAKVTETDENLYSVTLHCRRRSTEVPVYICPLYSPGLRQELTDGVSFDHLPLLALTEFYVIEVDEYTRSVVKIHTEGMPGELREKAIFQSVINTKTKFINYLAFMLSDSPEAFIAENNELECALLSGGNAAKEMELSTSLFEDMVRVAYADPARIKAIRSIVDKADKEVIPTSFHEMYAQFETAIKAIKRL